VTNFEDRLHNPTKEGVRSTILSKSQGYVSSMEPILVQDPIFPRMWKLVCLEDLIGLTWEKWAKF
jgi:hypothetical protein